MIDASEKFRLRSLTPYEIEITSLRITPSNPRWLKQHPQHILSDLRKEITR
jgi:hypothetical protein